MVTKAEMVEILGSRVGATDDPNDLTGENLDLNPNNRACKTYTGVAFDLFNPESWEFRRLDIARALSNACRFAGHIDPRTVGQHCIHVAELLKEGGYGPDVQLLGLLHDATEAYLLDIPRPWKSDVVIDGVPYVDREHDIEEALFEWAGIGPVFHSDAWKAVKEADLASFEVERASRARDGKVVLPYEHPNTVMVQYLKLWERLESEAVNG